MPPRCQLLSGSLPAPRALQRPTRGFTTSATLHKNALSRRRGGDLGSHLPKYIIPRDADIPEYPYGPSLLYKQSNRGLYGGQMIHFGNNVSSETETKTRRSWKPNVLSKSLYSVVLKKRIKLRMTSKVLKTIDREGGLDEYLLKQSEHRIKELGPMGWALRWTLLQRPEVVVRMRANAAALGVPQEEIDRQWPEPDPLVIAEQAAKEAAEEAAAQAVIDSEMFQEEQGVEEAAFDDEFLPEELATERTTRPRNIKAAKKAITEQAAKEYTRSLKAAQRYLKRGLVDTAEEGIKLAFVRERERSAARRHHRQAFKRNLEARFGDAKTADIDQPLHPAYRALQAEGVAKAGGYDEWRAQFVKPETVARHAAEVKQAGGEAALLAQKKAGFAKQIQNAEQAVYNETMDQAERQVLVSAIKRAQRAIDAGSKQAYIDAALEDWSERVEQRALAEAYIEETTARGESSGESTWASLANAFKGRGPGAKA